MLKKLYLVALTFLIGLSLVAISPAYSQKKTAGDKASGKAGVQKSQKKNKKKNVPAADAAADGASAAQESPRRKEMTFKTREYIFKQAGREIGRESFVRKLSPDNFIEGSAEVSVNMISRMTISQHYKLDALSMTLKNYELSAEVMGDNQNLKCAVDGGIIKFEIFRKGTTETMVLRHGGPIYLLDNLNANNFQNIIDAYSPKKGGKQVFTCLIPQRVLTTEIEIENAGFIKGKLANNAAEFIKYTAVEKTARLELIIYCNIDGSVASVKVPSQKFEMSAAGFLVDDERPAAPENVELYVNGKKMTDSGMTFDLPNDLKIYGKLMVPVLPVLMAEKKYKMPAVLIIAGSGPTDHDGNSKIMPGQINNLKDIAEYLALKNIVSLRYDKRNIGRSGMTGDSPFSAYVDDACFLVRKLMAMPAVDSSEIYVLGHSEGGLIALSMMPKMPVVKGYILMATPFEPMDKLIISQIKDNLYEVKLVPQKDKDDFIAYMSQLLDSMKKGKSVKAQQSITVPGMETMVAALVNQPVFVKEFLNIVPEKLAKACKKKALILAAEFDSQVAPGDADKLYDVIKKNVPATVKLFVKNANHVFKNASGKKDTASYTNPSNKVMTEALDAISNFVNKK